MSEPKPKPKAMSGSVSSLQKQIDQLGQRCAEAEEALDAIRNGTVDALVVYTDKGEKIYTIQGVESTYRLMIEAINEGVATLIDDGTILYCNQHFAQMLKVPLESIIATSIYNYIPEEYKASFTNLLSRGLKENCREETEFSSTDGNRIPVMISLNNFNAADSPGLCLVATDLTEQKFAAKMAALVELKTLAEEKLRHAHNSLKQFNEVLIAEITEHMQAEDDLKESRQKYQDLIETTSEFIWEMDSQGKYTYCSPQMETMWGIKPEDMIGKAPFDVMPPEEKARGSQGFQEMIRNASSFRDLLSTSYNVHGQLIYIETSGNPYFDQDGNFAGYRGITRDITERKMAEEKLRKAYDELEQRVQERTKDLQNALQLEQTMRLQLIQAEKLSALSRMMATVVHELNNPMQTIRNCVYLTKLETAPDSPIMNTLDMADSEINRVVNLVSGLKGIYRQPKRLVMESLSIVKVLSDVHTMLDPHLQHQSVTWQQQDSADPLIVNGIADHLMQVFLNISMNAIEAMQPDGGALTISTNLDKRKHEVLVTIADTGPGIDIENIEKIFEPFFTTKEGGSGLGLAICYEIVQQHAGCINVESQLNKGTTFTVILPTQQPPGN